MLFEVFFSGLDCVFSFRQSSGLYGVFRVFTHTVNQQVFAAGATITAQKAYSAGQQVSVDTNVAIGATNLNLVFALDVSQVQSFVMVSDQNLTVKTNSSGSPANTINLLANVPYVWTADAYHTFLLTTDVTSLYVTNASGALARLQIQALSDETV